MTAVATPMLRWSSVRDCPRKAVYEATGAPARERTQKEERILWRGRTLGRDYADMLAAQHGEHATERERKVIWPLGIGHIDVYVKETRTVVEILSSAHATGSYVHSKLLQAVGYAHFDPEAENVCLVVLNPSDYSEERIVVTPSSRQWDVLIEEMHERLNQLDLWRNENVLPGRVCAKPSEARGHFCQHAAHCFEGWEPPEHEQITDEAVHQLVARDYHAREKEREVKQTLKVIEEERKQIEAELAATIDPGAWQVGAYTVKRSDRTRRSFKLALAEEDSRIPSDLLDEFTNVSGYTVWTIDQALAEMGDIDYGDVPF